MNRKTVIVQFYRQPKYYKDFACIGGNCPMNCCFGWRINWTNEEVEKLKNADCSEHLRELINSAFKENGDIYKIKMNEKNKCPLLTEDNFCSIQREIGAEYLSEVCMKYPRKSRVTGSVALNYCYLSCYQVIHTLCNTDKCMVLENYLPKAKKVRSSDTYSEKAFLEHPEIKYDHDIFEFLYEIISDNSYSVETAVTLGAVAAQSISKLVDSGAYDKIPGNISALKEQLKNPDQIKKLEELKPNYAVKLGFVQEINKNVIKSNIMDIISEDGVVNIDKYNYGMKMFNEYFADRPFAMRNIALNLLLELSMPFRDVGISIFENYCYYAAAFAMYKMIAATAFLGKTDSYMNFISSSAYLSRRFAHNNENVKRIINVFKELNCASPAYIALILK